MGVQHTIYLTTVGQPPNYDEIRDGLFGFIPSFVSSVIERPYTASVPVWRWIVTFDGDVNPNPTPYLTAMIYPGINIVDLIIT